MTKREKIFNFLKDHVAEEVTIRGKGLWGRPTEYTGIIETMKGDSKAFSFHMSLPGIETIQPIKGGPPMFELGQGFNIETAGNNIFARGVGRKTWIFISVIEKIISKKDELTL